MATATAQTTAQNLVDLLGRDAAIRIATYNRNHRSEDDEAEVFWRDVSVFTRTVPEVEA